MSTLNRLGLRKLCMVTVAVLAGLLVSLSAWAWGWFETLPEPLEAGPQVTAAAKGLDEIRIDAHFEPEANRLTATQTLRVQNRWEDTLTSAVLRVYPNAFQSEETSPGATEELFDRCYPKGFSAGSLNLSALTVEGETAAYTYLDEAKTVLSVTLPHAWQPEQWLTLTLEYTVTVPSMRHRFGCSEDIWALGNVFPHLAVYEDGQWRQDEYVSIGDPFLSECANYEVFLRLDENYQAAASGYAVRKDGVYHYRAPAVRDFALVVAKEGSLRAQTVGNTVVLALGRTGSEAKRLLKYTAQALECYNRCYGAYPYASLTAAVVDFPFGGMEYPGLIMLGSELMDAKDDSLEVTIAHETAHQWWYAVVGSDQYYEAWQDEALCEYALLDYVSAYYGEAARNDLAFQRFETAMRVTVPEGITPGSPLDYFGDLPEYNLVTYRRGAALMVALEKALGRENFQQVLQTYYNTNAFRRVGRQAFKDALKAVSGSDWNALLEDYLDTYIIN